MSLIDKNGAGSLQKVRKHIYRMYLQFLQSFFWFFGVSILFAGCLAWMCQWGPWQTVRQELLTQAPMVVPFGDWQEPVGHSRAQMGRGPDSAWLLDYELKAGFPNPYVGISWRFGSVEGQDCLDLESVDSLVLEVGAKHARGITVQLIDALPRGTPKEPYRVLQASLAVDPETKARTLALDDFAVPEWWKNGHDLPVLGSIPKHLNRVCRLDLVAGGYVENGILDQMSVLTVYAYGPNWLGRILSWTLLGLICVGGVAWELARRQKARLEQEKEIARHVPLDLDVLAKPTGPDLWPKIQAWLLREYENPDCDLQSVATGVQLSKRQVSEILRARTGLGFREYLNVARLREAERLLSTGTLQVQAIAFRVGFGNVSHFNRVFKEKYGQSPKEWRAQKGLGSESSESTDTE